MDLGFLLRGAVIGFSIAAPVGPIGVLCIRRTLTEGRASGFVSGLGAATADALYGAIAGFGLTVIASFLLSHEVWLQLIGGLVLCALGVKAYLTAPAPGAATGSSTGLVAAYASTFFLTLSNPATILMFLAIFAGLGVTSAGGRYLSAALLVLGVFLGSAFWWLILSSSIGLLGSKVTTRGFRWVNRLSGMILAGFGLLALASVKG